MRWYEGDIAQAVASSKSKNAVFVVYVEGQDEKSASLTSLINDTEISSKLESNTFVAIKVEAGSVSHNQFSAIYKTVPVPSLFFIGKNGTTIDIIKDAPASSELATRINTIIQLHTGVAAEPVTPQQSTDAKQSEDFIKSEQNQEPAATEKQADVCDNGVCTKEAYSASTSKQTEEEPSPSKESTEFLNTEKQELSKEEKIQRAKELVDQKREAKKQEEEENEKAKEIERRKMGQEVQKMQRWQQDQDLKNMMEERQRAKNEEKVARDRILAQIAQDKADRAARFGTSPPATEPVAPPARPAQSSSTNSNSARLQFRLPDGTSKTHDFESTTTLQEVRNFVVQNLHLPFRNFSLSTTFPRREFTAENNEDTMKDLELCPNAVILILPSHSAGTVASNESGGLLSLFWLLVSPILNIFGYFRNLIFGQPTTDAAQPPERNKRSTGDSDDQQSQPQPPTKRKAMDSTVVRRQGSSNIHRLTDRTDSDEDNNTWNGNSTQQM